MEYKNAIKLVGVADGTFDHWDQKVKRATALSSPHFGQNILCENPA